MDASGVTDDVRGARRFIVVANRTGGQGKTLLAHLLSVRLRLRDPGFRVMCADSVEPVGPGGLGISKLGRSVSGVIEVGAGPSPSEVQSDPNLALEFWDALGAPLLDRSRSGCLLDVGANVVDQILDWARTADLEAVFAGGVVTDLVVPVVATAKSVADARDVAAFAVRPGGLPVRSVSLVENAWQGVFAPLAGNPDYAALLDIVRTSGGSVCPFPECRSQILPYAERGHLSIGEVLEWDFVEVARRFEWSHIKASREVKLFAAWVSDAVSGLDAAGLTNPFPSLAGPDHEGGRVRDLRPV